MSLVLAPAGTAMFWVTQAGWAMTAGTPQAVDSNAPIRTANVFFILSSPLPDEFVQLVFEGDHVGGWSAVKLRGVQVPGCSAQVIRQVLRTTSSN